MLWLRICLLALWWWLPLIAPAGDDCPTLPTSAEFTTRAIGLEILEAKIDAATINSITVIRLAPEMWSPKVWDMRQVGSLYTQQKKYLQPAYSVEESLTFFRGDVVASSAGFTQTYNAPVPAGLVQLDYVEHSPVFQSRVLDGFVCVQPSGQVSILSRLVEGVRRAPENAQGCRDAVQAGPVLVFDAKPQISTHAMTTLRVALGVDAAGRTLLVYSPSATTRGLGCALSSQAIGATAAINLQGDAYGGIAFSALLERNAKLEGLGTPDRVVATALVFARNNGPSAAMPSPNLKMGSPQRTGAASRLNVEPFNKAAKGAPVVSCSETRNAMCK
ncbi:phosphodiester glycosidase family protein [Ramlibacter sp. XY19]|uniref:phosphodiester glycosidase family protein n=1 Tax=Ramlibacter paludis TaxID=2908000 RepID=UPI0023DBDD79|nr:phosphodiester glycosidase family protein [Ramlibacter paludis]MCG2592985.1 phosphodiester glycosidase family protein [Ramlibacter paludis]